MRKMRARKAGRGYSEGLKGLGPCQGFPVPSVTLTACIHTGDIIKAAAAQGRMSQREVE